jgi:hypothetical protein
MHGAEFIGEMFSDLTKGSIFISSLANETFDGKTNISAEDSEAT